MEGVPGFANTGVKNTNVMLLASSNHQRTLYLRLVDNKPFPSVLTVNDVFNCANKTIQNKEKKG